MVEDDVAGLIRRDFATRPDDPGASGTTYSWIDMSEFTCITRFALVEVDDAYGFGVDDISFTVHPSAATGP